MKTKNQIIDEIFGLHDELVKLHKNELKNALENKKLTTGGYYYDLNPFRNYALSVFYGDNNKKAMFLNENHYKKYEFYQVLFEAKKLKEKMLEAIV